MREDDLYEQIAQYIRVKYPGVPYHFDLSGVWTPSHKARNLYGKVNQKAWPDLHIAKPRRTPFLGVHMEYAGLFLELKREGSRLKKKDGTWASLHIAEQATMLDILAEQGYVAQFAVGYDQAAALIDSYLEAS